MSEHSTHCRDPHCYGCTCTPDCDYWDEEQMNDYLDPATLTPETLYRLQAETWEQGATHERDRIIALLEAEAKVISDQFADYIESDFIHAIIELIKGENNG